MTIEQPLFLTDEEVERLTGACKSVKQIEVLKQNRIHFYLNAQGRPIVARSAIDGSQKQAQNEQPWKLRFAS